MGEEQVGATSSSAAITGVSPSVHFQSSVKMLARDRFYVELKPDETTVVSWKKLVRDSEKMDAPHNASEVPPGAHPALEARIAPEVGAATLLEDPLPPPPNRFNSVIEKIERLYKGDHSSDEDENLSDVPEDDKYDTNDSFIDDEELNDYFSVEKAKIKHSGFFINKGKLERLLEPTASPVFGPKKRKQRDGKYLHNDKVPEDLPHKLLNSGVRMKAAARKVSMPTFVTSESVEGKHTGSALPCRQTNHRDNSVVKMSKRQVSQSESGKVRESYSHECKKGPADTIGQDEGRSRNQDIAKNIAAGDNLTTMRIQELSFEDHVHLNGLERDSSSQSETAKVDISKDVLAVGLSKIKSLHKEIIEESAREGVASGGRLPPTAKISPLNVKEISPGRLKWTTLERAVHDLERAVAELCPPSSDIQEAEQASSLGGKSKRLPQDVKQKLAKVARLAAKQGKISDDFITRLMGILGHVMHLKTLKRNLKEMIEMGLYARQEKEGRLQDIKREVTEMVKTRVSLQAKDIGEQECSDDLQANLGYGEKGSTSGRYKWDYATEDRICDLYEQYIEGMDEFKGPQLRKLYAELVELWPDGWMDNIGIKLAVQRAKERKNKQTKLVSCAEDLARKRRVSDKLKAEEILFKEALPFVTSYSSYCLNASDQSIGHNSHQTEGVRDLYSRSANSGEKKKHSRPSVKDLYNVQRKKFKESAGLRKIRRKLEKCITDSVITLTKGNCLENTMQMTNVGSFQ